MVFSKNLFEHGYLWISHQNSPGLPEDIARQVGYDPVLCKEGKVFEASTMRCAHCSGHIVKNPLRVRERGHCPKCDWYVCDACAVAMKDPNYTHCSMDERVDKTTSGKWAFSGPMSNPVITPAGD